MKKIEVNSASFPISANCKAIAEDGGGGEEGDRISLIMVHLIYLGSANNCAALTLLFKPVNIEMFTCPIIQMDNNSNRIYLFANRPLPSQDGAVVWCKYPPGPYLR
jgi:hypothetical protein